MTSLEPAEVKQKDPSREARPKLRLLLLSLAGGANVALADFFLSGFFPEQHYAAILTGSFVFIWSIGAGRAILGVPPLSLLIMMVGLIWGFFFALGAAINIQNMCWSVNLVPYIVALTIFPLVATLLQLPLYLFRTRVLSYVPLLCTAALFIALILAAKADRLPFLYKVKAPKADYDIAAQQVTISPKPVVSHGKYLLSYSIRNAGPTSIPGETYEVEFYIDGDLVSFDRRTSTLHPKEPNTYYAKFNADLTPGAHNYRLIVDPNDRLPEIDETNNTLKGSFEVVSESQQKDVP